MIHSITWFYVQIIRILVHNLIPCFPGLASWSGSLNLQSNTFFSPNHHHPFLKHVHTIAIYFFVPLLPCLLFLTAINNDINDNNNNHNNHNHNHV